MIISDFRRDYAFLSNFYHSPFIFADLTYPTNEHYFQAFKADTDALHMYVLRSKTPSEAKSRGRKIKIRPDWNLIRNDVMKIGLFNKFVQNKELYDKLLYTGDAELIESNTWGDTYWGVCNGIGENWLGKLLMEVRDEIK